MDKMQTRKRRRRRKKTAKRHKENVMSCGVVKLVFVVASNDAHKLVSCSCYNIFHEQFSFLQKSAQKNKSMNNQ